MGKRVIQSTANYRLFERSSENRKTDLKKHKKLLESMKVYGFLACFPIVVRRDYSTGKYIVKEGQHRLVIAEQLGLEVWFVEEEIDFDIAVINCTARVWVLRDYAEKFAANGLMDYREAIDFSERHSLPLGTSISLLAGTTSFSNCSSQFVDGEFKVKDQKWANDVAAIYSPLILMSPALKSVRLVEACMAVCRVPGFDARRLLSCAKRCREKLIPYSTKDAYLDMLEEIYNFGHNKLVGLKSAAIMAMRERNAVSPKKGRSSADEAA